MSQGFKNALCLAAIPDASGYGDAPWQLRCKRRPDHPGPHRVKFRDGKYRVWNTGDEKSKITRKPAAR